MHQEQYQETASSKYLFDLHEKHIWMLILLLFSDPLLHQGLFEPSIPYCNFFADTVSTFD